MVKPHRLLTATTLPLQWISPLRNPHSRTHPSPPPPAPPPSRRRRRRYIDHTTAVRLISAEPDPQRALDIFNHAASQPGFNHNHSTYSAVLHSLARRGKFRAVDALLRRMAHEPCRFQEPVLLNLMAHFSRFKLPDRTLDMFYSIPAVVRSNPSFKALSTCLNHLVEADRFDLAERLLADAKSKFHMQPNSCIYNILVKHHCKKRDLDSAFSVLEMMRTTTDSAPPNLITYSTLVGRLCDDGRLKDAFQLFEEMIASDNITPDPLTYNLLINGFCKKGMVDKAKQVMEFMRGNGCEPNVFNYSSLMNGLCKEGRLDEARQVFDEMRKIKRIGIDVVCYTTLINSYCKVGKTDEGIGLIVDMKERGCRPDTVLMNLVISGLCNERRFSEVMALLDKAPYDGLRLNKGSYRIVMNCLCREEGEVERAVELLGLMLGRGIVPHFAASNGLLVRLCEAGKVVDAVMALSGLVETGFLPEAGTWGSLVEAVSRERKLTRAFLLLGELTI